MESEGQRGSVPIVFVLPIILVGIVIIALTLNLRGAFSKLQSDTEKMIGSPAPSSTSVGSGWATLYGNGFQINYPANWEAPSLALDKSVQGTPTTNQSYLFSSNMLITLSSTYDQTLQRWLTYQEELANIKQTYPVISTTPITVAGQTTTEFIVKETVVANGALVVVQGKTPQTILSLDMTFYNPGDQQIFEKMLASLTLADAASLPSGIAGKMESGPTCPVQKVGQDCTISYQGMVAVETTDTKQPITQFIANADGTFAVPLPPGTYLLVPQTGTSMFPRSAEQTVTITAGKITPVTITFDTGIR